MRLVHRVINQKIKLMAQSIPSVPIPPSPLAICRVFVRKPGRGRLFLSVSLATVQYFTYF